MTTGPAATHLIACHNPPLPDEAERGRPTRAGHVAGPGARGRDRTSSPRWPPSRTVSRDGPESARARRQPPPADGDGRLLEVRDLKVWFPITEGLIRERHVGDVRAVDGISFKLRRGETLGLVGESGCGKSTTGRAIVRLYKPTGGRILFDGQDVTEVEGAELRKLRRRFQMIFQDPYASLDPRMTAGAHVGEPLDIHDMGTKAERRERVRELLSTVGLNPDYGEPVPARVLRRPAPAHRRGPRARPGPGPDRRGRAHLRARRLDPGPGHQPAGAAPGPARR